MMWQDDFSNYVDLSDHYVDFSENYVDLSDIKLTNRAQLGALANIQQVFTNIINWLPTKIVKLHVSIGISHVDIYKMHAKR